MENIPFLLEFSFFDVVFLISSYLGNWLYHVVEEFEKKKLNMISSELFNETRGLSKSSYSTFCSSLRQKKGYNGSS